MAEEVDVWGVLGELFEVVQFGTGAVDVEGDFWIFLLDGGEGGYGFADAFIGVDAADDDEVEGGTFGFFGLFGGEVGELVGDGIVEKLGVFEAVFGESFDLVEVAATADCDG